MTRVSTPRPGEPIRLVETREGVRYRVVVDVSRKGERRRQATRTLDTLGEARRFVAATRAAVAEGTYLAPSRETVADLTAEWLATRHDVREVTRAGYASALRPVLAVLGDRRAQEVTPRDVQALVEL